MAAARGLIALAGASAIALLTGLTPLPAVGQTPTPSSSETSAAPSPSDSPSARRTATCLGAVSFTFFGSTHETTAGSTIFLGGTERDSCLAEQPPRQFTLMEKRPADPDLHAVDTTTGDRFGNFAFLTRPSETSEYAVEGLPLSWTVEVTPATGAPSPSAACVIGTSLLASKTLIAPREFVFVGGATRAACVEPEPQHSVTLLTRAFDQSAFTAYGTTTSNPRGDFAFLVQPVETTDYAASSDAGVSPTVRVNVSRSAGQCTGVVTLAGPTRARIGSTVTLSGRATGSDLYVLFRRHGEGDFTVRRILRTNTYDGPFAVTYVSNDDYEYYAADASSTGCASRPARTLAAPVVSGPALTTRGASVALSVRTLPGQPIRVYFRRAGSTVFQLRRVAVADATGLYRTSYRADVDYRYYAVTGPDDRLSNVGLTQVR
ncbi:MAG: hypothetical protein LC640_02975 [Frankia sp.]|nr:hypothetical protein [Frankia sp.]